MKSTHVGIFSGSFNPIHIGHLALANWLCAYKELDEVWFVITPHNPLKQKDQLMDDEQRLEMAQAAIQGYSKFRVSDVEFHLPQPSYSIDTLRALSQAHPDKVFYFIIGADNWQLFPRWKAHEEILRNYNLLIYPRRGYPITLPEHYPNVQIADAPMLEISSTFIRQSLAEGKDVRFFLPEGVRPYFYA